MFPSAKMTDTEYKNDLHSRTTKTMTMGNGSLPLSFPSYLVARPSRPEP